jgi:hypothetical protein
VDFASDVWVGRAPVESAAQARAFVDKVITYERLETPDGEHAVDTSYLQKVLFAADWWGREIQSRQTDTSVPPEEGTFTHVAGTSTTKVRTKFDLTMNGGNPSHRLVARRTDTDVVVPFDPSASSGELAWSFRTSETYATQSAAPTRFVRVTGPEADIDPEFLFWDPVGLEGAAHEKEDMRAKIKSWYPNFSSVTRFYADHFDLSTPPPLQPLEEAPLRAELNNGWHFVSLTGHGWPGGCCGVNVAAHPDFANHRKYSIAFADSCSTARPDSTDSFGEVAAIDPDGGMVAYVGNTRYSWIGVGDNYEQFFWCALKAFGRTGPAAGLRLATSGIRAVWTIYAQTPYGDPEMPAWTDVPKAQELSVPETVFWGDPLEVVARHLGSGASGHTVTVLEETESGPHLLGTKTTDSGGRVRFPLPGHRTDTVTLQVTASRNGFKPAVAHVTARARRVLVRPPS